MAWNPPGSLFVGAWLPFVLRTCARPAVRTRRQPERLVGQEEPGGWKESFGFLRALASGNSAWAPSSFWFSCIKLHLVTKVGGRLMTFSGRGALMRQGISCGGLTPSLTDISPMSVLALGPRLAQDKGASAPGAGSASCLQSASPGDRLLQSLGWASPVCLLFPGRGDCTMPSRGCSLPCIGCTRRLAPSCFSRAHPCLEKPTGQHQQ